MGVDGGNLQAIDDVDVILENCPITIVTLNLLVLCFRLNAFTEAAAFRSIVLRSSIWNTFPGIFFFFLPRSFVQSVFVLRYAILFLTKPHKY